LRGVQQDPANFLAIKFNMQLQSRESHSQDHQDDRQENQPEPEE
jgi:hypothetical protein